MHHHNHIRGGHRPDGRPGGSWASNWPVERTGNQDGAHPDRRFARDPLESGERHGPHRHGGRRRLFDYGDLRFILLRMIVDKPAHGYDLIKALEERMGGGYSPSPGVIYPTLTLLEEQGLADVTADSGKKLYRATAEGVAYLQANQTAVDAIQARIDAVARERNILPPPQLVRALENLKTALRLRLAGGPVAAERVAAIAAAIDAAAAEAERGRQWVRLKARADRVTPEEMSEKPGDAHEPFRFPHPLRPAG
jgi:DNA-binding PadR family transcriptional regulator